MWVLGCVGVQGSPTRNALVCASSEDSRKSVRSLESVSICADFYNSSKSKYILHLLHVQCIVKQKYRILIILL